MTYIILERHFCILSTEVLFGIWYVVFSGPADVLGTMPLICQIHTAVIDFVRDGKDAFFQLIRRIHRKSPPLTVSLRTYFTAYILRQCVTHKIHSVKPVERASRACQQSLPVVAGWQVDLTFLFYWR